MSKLAENPGTSPTDADSGSWEQLSEVRYYAKVLEEIFDDIEQARGELRPNYAALAALRRRAQDAREKLDEVREALQTKVQAEIDPYAEAADSDLIDILVNTIAELPAAVVVRLQAAIDERMDGTTAPTDE